MAGTISTLITWISENIIALLALVVSLRLLVVDHINQIERRNGEITQLSSNFLNKISISKQKLMSSILHMQAARSSLRTMIDCDEKYEWIEQIPEMLKQAKENLDTLETTRENLMKVRGGNSSKLLLKLQSMLHDFNTLEESANSVEKSAFSAVSFIQSHQIDSIN